jgi:hypothetical protein
MPQERAAKKQVVRSGTKMQERRHKHHEDRIMKHDAVVKVDGGCPSPRHRRQIAWLLLLLPSCRPSRRLTATWIPTFWLLAALAAGRLSWPPAGDARSGLTPKLVLASRRPLAHAQSGWRGSKSSATGENRAFTSREQQPIALHLLPFSCLQTQVAHSSADTDKIGNAPRIQRS